MEVTVTFRIAGVDFSKMSGAMKRAFQDKAAQGIAETAGVLSTSIHVQLSPGSVRVDATITSTNGLARNVESSLQTSTTLASNVIAHVNAIPDLQIVAVGNLNADALLDIVVAVGVPILSPPNSALGAPTKSPTRTPTESTPTCYNTDNHALDRFGRNCTHYESKPWLCHKYDDEQFASHSLCCGCGGGAYEVPCFQLVTLEVCDETKHCMWDGATCVQFIYSAPTSAPVELLPNFIVLWPLALVGAAGSGFVVAVVTLGLSYKCFARRPLNNAKRRLFLLVEFIDSGMDVTTFLLVDGEGDLEFSNDAGAIRWSLIAITACSVLFFLAELIRWTGQGWRVFKARHAAAGTGPATTPVGVAPAAPGAGPPAARNVSCWLRVAIVLHMGFEDTVQAVLYALVGASQAADGVGITTALWLAMVQTVLFMFGKFVGFFFT